MTSEDGDTGADADEDGSRVSRQGDGSDVEKGGSSRSGPGRGHQSGANLGSRSSNSVTRKTASQDSANGTVAYDSGPEAGRLSESYGIALYGKDQAEKIQRLESEFGAGSVTEWVDEGMTVETMGKPREMQAFRERQNERSEAIPADIERQNQASVHRNSSAGADSGPAGEAGEPDVLRRVLSKPGRSMDETVQREMESKMGGDFSEVRMHLGPEAAAAADSIGARAFTVGNHVAFNRGEYDPGSEEGKRVLAHELTHVRQQTAGRVSLLPKTDRSDLDVGDEDYHVQPKLSVSSPDDPAEKEAETVADAVIEMNASSGSGQAGDLADVGPDSASTARAGSGSAGGETIDSGTESVVREGIRGSGKPLGTNVRNTFERAMGADFSDVEVHDSASANQAAASVNAEAYTMGSDIAFADGNYNPDSKGGKELLAHELTHVAQQTGAGVQPRRSITSIGLAPTRKPSDSVLHRSASSEDEDDEFDYSGTYEEDRDISQEEDAVRYESSELDRGAYITEDGTIVTEDGEEREVEVGEDGIIVDAENRSSTDIETEDGHYSDEQEREGSFEADDDEITVGGGGTRTRSAEYETDEGEVSIEEYREGSVESGTEGHSAEGSAERTHEVETEEGSHSVEGGVEGSLDVEDEDVTVGAGGSQTTTREYETDEGRVRVEEHREGAAESRPDGYSVEAGAGSTREVETDDGQYATEDRWGGEIDVTEPAESDEDDASDEDEDQDLPPSVASEPEPEASGGSESESGAGVSASGYREQSREAETDEGRYSSAERWEGSVDISESDPQSEPGAEVNDGGSGGMSVQGGRERSSDIETEAGSYSSESEVTGSVDVRSGEGEAGEESNAADVSADIESRRSRAIETEDGSYSTERERSGSIGVEDGEISAEAGGSRTRSTEYETDEGSISAEEYREGSVSAGPDQASVEGRSSTSYEIETEAGRHSAEEQRHGSFEADDEGVRVGAGGSSTRTSQQETDEGRVTTGHHREASVEAGTDGASAEGYSATRNEVDTEEGRYSTTDRREGGIEADDDDIRASAGGSRTRTRERETDEGTITTREHRGGSVEAGTDGASVEGQTSTTHEVETDDGRYTTEETRRGGIDADDEGVRVGAGGSSTRISEQETDEGSIRSEDRRSGSVEAGTDGFSAAGGRTRSREIETETGRHETEERREAGVEADGEDVTFTGGGSDTEITEYETEDGTYTTEEREEGSVEAGTGGLSVEHGTGESHEIERDDGSRYRTEEERNERLDVSDGEVTYGAGSSETEMESYETDAGRISTEETTEEEFEIGTEGLSTERRTSDADEIVTEDGSRYRTEEESHRGVDVRGDEITAGAGSAETETVEYETESGTYTAEERSEQDVEIGTEGVTGSMSDSSTRTMDTDEGSITQSEQSESAIGIDSESVTGSHSQTDSEVVETDDRTETRTRSREIEGSLSGDGAEGSIGLGESHSVEGDDYEVSTERHVSLGGNVQCDIEEIEEGTYEFSLSIGLSGSIGGSTDAEFELNGEDDSLQSGSGNVSGGGEAGVHGGVQYTQTRVFDEADAARYQSHLDAVEGTPAEGLLEAAEWPEFDIIAKIKALLDSETSDITGGLAGVMGDPSAIDALEKGESYSLETFGGWNFSLEGEAMTDGSMPIGVGASGGAAQNWERTVEVERVDEVDEEDRTAETEEPEEVETYLEDSLFFDTGASDPYVGDPRGDNRAVVEEIQETLTQLQSYGRPEHVEFDITGHASQRWAAAEDSSERQAKNQELSEERARQTADLILQAYNETETGEWPMPDLSADGSLEATESPTGIDPTTDYAAFRRADVDIRMSEPQPDPSHSGKIRIKVGFSEASEIEGSGGLDVGAVSGGVSHSKAESEDIYSTFEIYETVAYFEDFYEDLVGASSPEELTDLQQDEVYNRHWVGTDVAASMEEKMGPDFEVGNAKVSIRYGGIDEGSWAVTPDGITAGEATGGFQVGGTLSYGEHELDLPEISTEANIERIPEGFEVDIQSVRSFKEKRLEGTILSPDEVAVLAHRAQEADEDRWSNHMTYRAPKKWWQATADETSFDIWEEFRQTLADPTLPDDLPDELEPMWDSVKTYQEKDPDEQEVPVSDVEAEFKEAVRANAFRPLFSKLGPVAKHAVESALFTWNTGGDVGLPFEFPGHMEEQKDELTDLRHIDVPAFLRVAENELNSITPGSTMDEEVIERRNNIVGRLDELRSTIMENETEFADPDKWAAMIGELDSLRAEVRERYNALLQVSTWDPDEDDPTDYGAQTLWDNIEDKEETITAYADRFNRQIDEAYDQYDSFGEILPGTESAEDMLPDSSFFEEWGDQMDALEDLIEEHPDIDVNSIPPYVEERWPPQYSVRTLVGTEVAWNRFEEIYVDRRRYDPEDDVNRFKHLVSPY